MNTLDSIYNEKEANVEWYLKEVEPPPPLPL